jgi:hypothetical protein
MRAAADVFGARVAPSLQGNMALRVIATSC